MSEPPQEPEAPVGPDPDSVFVEDVDPQRVPTPTRQLTQPHAPDVPRDDASTPSTVQLAPSPSPPPGESPAAAAAAAANDGASFRNIAVMRPDAHHYVSNIIKTTKYTIIPFFLDFFLWKMLYEQFQRQANIYFAVISALQLVPGLSPTGRFTTLMTLCIVLVFSMCKSGFEDYKRYKKDTEINSRTAYVLRPEKELEDGADGGSAPNADTRHVWRAVPYTDVRVGDVIRVTNVPNRHGERQNDIPCDIALLTTSEADGTAYVETANLDGETNLKSRRCLEQTKISIEELRNTAWGLSTSQSTFSFEPAPIGRGGAPRLGAADDQEPSGAAEQSRQQSLVALGSRRHSHGSTSMSAAEFVKSAPMRTSNEIGRIARSRYGGMRLETEHPNNSLYTFTGNLYLDDGSLVSLSPEQMLYRGCMLRKVQWIIGVVVFTGAETKVMQNAKKPPHKSSRVELLVNKLLISILMLQVVMCAACTVGLTVVSHSMWYLQEQDVSTARRSGLGFLTFVILFNNLIPISLYVSLEMIKFIQGRMMEQDLCMYYAPRDMPANAKTTDLNEELGQINYIFSDKTGTLTRNIMTFMKFCINGKVYGTGTTEIGRAAAKRQGKELVDDRPEEVRQSAFPFWDPRLSNSKWLSHPEADQIRQLFQLLALCHTVVIDSGKFEAESPDEEALVKAAREFGLRFVGRNSESITLHVGAAGVEEKYKLLEVIEFNSDRKRMSVIVLTPAGEVQLLMKGADNVMLERLSADTAGIEDTKRCLAQFGDEGLRTLMLSQRVLPQAVWEPWVQRFRAAKSIIGDNARRARLMGDLAAEIEVGMTLVGCTAIEDKLQEGVPATIEALRTAGLKVWMLTGDKVETAINIAFACALLHTSMHSVHMVELSDSDVILAVLEDLAAKGGDADKSLVIDGATLGFILARPELCDKLYEATNLCTSVVCSRVSPKQKADVVEMVRARAGDAVSLAIGDGANDVPMIQAAHVGVGISGMEGQQAANAADYAIGQFKYLHRLIMIHGRANYYRLTHTINYFFYKNIVLVMTQFWFCFFNNFTGQSLYEQWSLALYNVSWTALPVIIYGIFDRDILNTDNVHMFPTLYEPGLKSSFLNITVFLKWIVTALYHSAICFFVVMFGWGAQLSDDGSVLSLDGAGVTLYTCVIFVANTKLALHIHSFTWIHHLTVWGSIAVWFLFLAVYGSFPSTFSKQMYRILQNVGFQAAPWLFFFLCVLLSLARDFFWKYAQSRLLPMAMVSLLLKVRFKDSCDPLAATRPPLEIRKRDGFSRSDVLGDAELGDLFDDYAQEQVTINPAQGFMMQFVDNELEDEFIFSYIGRMRRYKVGVGLCSIASLLLVGAFVLQRDSVEDLEIYMWALFSISAWICFALLMLVDIKRNLHPIMLLLVLVGFSGMTIANLVASQQKADTHPVTMGVILLGLLTVVRPPVIHAVQYVIIAFLCYLCWYQGFRVPEWQRLEFAVRFLEVAIVALTALVSLASSEKFMRRMFISQKQVKASCDLAAKEEARSLRLLANVLPSAIVKEVRMNKRQLSAFSVLYKEASMLNSDIVKFTQFSSTKEPHVVVEMLNRMFTKFDAHSAALGIEKIKTIGDAYVAAAGIPIPDALHMQKIIAMGLRMVDSIGEMNEEGLSTLRVLNIQIRIGCATGPVKSGVVGMQKVCYDVFGDTPHESELMEQQGRPNRVRVSKAMYHALTTREGVDDSMSFEVLDGGYFVASGDKSVPVIGDAEHHQAHMPITEVRREDIYQFLEDHDSERREIIRLWAGFEGRQTRATLQFEEVEFAERDFRSYLRHLAHTRFLTELLQGSFLFLLCGLLIALYIESFVEGVAIALLAVAVVHLALLGGVAGLRWRRNAGARQRRQRGNSEDDVSGSGDDGDDEDVDGGEGGMERRLTRAQSVGIQPGGGGGSSDPEAVGAKSEGEGREGLCTPVRGVMSMSSALAFLSPLAVLVIVNWNGRAHGISTVAVFVILSATIYIMNTFHLRIVHKYVFAGVSLVAVSGAFFYSTTVERSFVAGNDGGDYFAILLCYALSIISSYATETTVRKSFAAAKNVVYQNAEVQSATALCDKLLNNVLPAPIVRRMKANPGEQIVDEVEEASVCFLYMEGLLDAVAQAEQDAKAAEPVADATAEAASSAKEAAPVPPPHTSDDDDDDGAALLIEHMNKFLVILDGLTTTYGVEKIKTTPFLVVSGCPEPCATHAQQLIAFAVEVVASVRRFNAENGTNVRIKIGVHSGKVTAGVLGSTKFLYDIFGDTVNFASRLTSSADWGDIQLSSVTRGLVQGQHATRHRGQIELKGKGVQDIYVLEEQEAPPAPAFAAAAGELGGAEELATQVSVGGSTPPASARSQNKKEVAPPQQPPPPAASGGANAEQLGFDEVDMDDL